MRLTLPLLILGYPALISAEKVRYMSSAVHRLKPKTEEQFQALRLKSAINAQGEHSNTAIKKINTQLN